MAKYIIMALVCLLVGGACTATLITFFRKLRKIEEERWGQRKDIN